MTIDSQIFDALKVIPELALSGGKFAIYPDAFPQPPANPVWPAVRYTIAGGTIYEDLCGDGDEETDDVRVQIDLVTQKPPDRRLLWSAVRAAMKNLATPAVLQAPPVFTYDAETKTYRAMADWMIQGSST